MIPEARLGWFAGVIDLRGYFIYKANQQRATQQVVLMVESKHAGVITQMCEMTGQQVDYKRPQHLKEWMRRGCSQHCPESHIHVETEQIMPQTARWTSTGAAMAVIVFNILPYLTEEVTETIEIMERAIQNAAMTGRGSGATIAAVKRLAGLGWEIPPELLDRMIPDQPEPLAITAGAVS